MKLEVGISEANCSNTLKSVRKGILELSSLEDKFIISYILRLVVRMQALMVRWKWDILGVPVLEKIGVSIVKELMFT